jgi:peptidoglycan/LPS O-acetylase OafA/YrhL
MKRDIAIDYLRSCVTVLVVAHHSGLAYNTFSHFNPARYTASTAPVVDTIRWAPLDYFVAWNDIFFMALMFLISGLFVAPALGRKGAGRFFADRAKRLGIPFAIAVTVLMPLAYYPSWRLSDDADRGGYLRRFFTSDGWPVGPPWFLWLLLAFCAFVALAYWLAPRLGVRFSWQPASGWGLAAVFLAASLVATVPGRLFVPPYSWSSLGGPLAFQTSRLLLYLVWFLLGVSLGGENLQRSLSASNLRPWPFWLLLGLAGFVAHWFFSGSAFRLSMPAWLGNGALTIVFTVCCAFTSLAALGVARFFARAPWPVAASLSENAYGIYILHYSFVTWMQFSLLSQRWPVALKFAIVFAVALAGSWVATAGLRRTAARRVL